MPQICPDRSRIRAETPALLMLAVSLLILPLPWLFAAVLAGAVHELCHWAAVCLCGGKVCHLHIGPRGARMAAPPMTPWQNMLCALAGPLGGLSLLFLGRYFPRLALCAAIQSAYNLLPVYPFDGGHVLENLLSVFFPSRLVYKICGFVTQTTCVFLLLLGLYATCIWRVGILGLLLAVATVARIRGNSRKTPCNTHHFTIQ